ncbi:MAG: hypothetical protein J0H98_01405 [Solirubrobacterales bacterium]|nr:hypothetical protein [Solirubrobacterales bacterium]
MIATAVLLFVAGKVVFDNLSLQSSIAALMLIAVAAVFMVLSRQDLLEIVQRVEKIGPVGIGAFDAAKAASGLGKATNEMTEEGDDLEFSESMLGLRLELEMKMSSLAKRVFGAPKGRIDGVDPGQVGYLTIGGLYSSEFISREQSRLASVILTWTDDLRRPPSENRLQWNVKNFVDKFRIIVFAAVVEDTVERTGGFEVSKTGRREGERDISILHLEGKRKLTLVPAFTLVSDGKVVERISTRLEKQGKRKEDCAIVVPNGSKARQIDGGPELIQFKNMDRSWLEDKLGITDPGKVVEEV